MLKFKSFSLIHDEPERGTCWRLFDGTVWAGLAPAIVKTPTSAYCVGVSGPDFETLEQAQDYVLAERDGRVSV